MPWGRCLSSSRTCSYRFRAVASLTYLFCTAVTLQKALLCHCATVPLELFAKSQRYSFDKLYLLSRTPFISALAHVLSFDDLMGCSIDKLAGVRLALSNVVYCQLDFERPIVASLALKLTCICSRFWSSQPWPTFVPPPKFTSATLLNLLPKLTSTK